MGIGLWGGVVLDGGVGVEEEGAVGGGEVGDDVAEGGVLEGRPRGGGDLAPEGVVQAEAADGGGGGGGGGEGGAVEACEDVGVEEV